MLALRGGGFEQVADRTEETQGRHDQGGWSQARFQRHLDNLDLEHYKVVAEELERLLIAGWGGRGSSSSRATRPGRSSPTSSSTGSRRP